MKSTRSLHLTLLVTLAFVLTVTFPGFSSAAFTASSRTTAQVTAAPDWTPPTVLMTSPGETVKDVVTLQASATDRESGIASVKIEMVAPNADWTTVCTTASAPYTCAWNTLSLPDGQYSLRAVAVDGAGHSTTSEVVRTAVANKVLVVLTDPGEAIRGTVALVTTVHNAGSLSHTVRVEYAVSGSTSWKSICTALRSPYTCSWNTTAIAAGEYDLRSVLSSGGTSTYSALVEDVVLDNTAPTVTLVDPGTPMSGARTFTANASDAHSGVDRVVFQYAGTGTTSWKELCTVTDEPWSCRVATSTLPDGSYGFRAVATDAAGNTTTSAVVGNRVVDNTISSVTVDVPSSLTGHVTLGATAASTAGVAQVRIQVAPAGTAGWTDVCTDSSSPWSCGWNTATVADGLYDFRAVMTDGLGRTLTSPVDSANLVDNSPLRGVDVQTRNGGASAGKADSGDTVTLTYSSQIDPTRVLSGWNGTSRAVTVRMRDGLLSFKGSKEDQLDVLSNGNAVHLGSVNLKQDYVKGLRTVQFNATMTAGTITTATGLVRSTVTLTLGSVASGSSGLRSITAGSTMTWTPSANVTDLQGRPCSGALVTETGPLDKEF